VTSSPPSFNTTAMRGLLYSVPAEEVTVAFVDVDGAAVAIGHIAQAMLVDSDVGRQVEWY